MATITYESPAVHNYINNLQTVINRMAANSASVKTWCITLVSAVIVFAADNSKPEAIWIALIPISLCFILDSYYLGLERVFRKVYNEFINKLNINVADSKDLFVLTPKPESMNNIKSTLTSMSSFSVFPFYGLILCMIAIYRVWIF